MNVDTCPACKFLDCLEFDICDIEFVIQGYSSVYNSLLIAKPSTKLWWENRGELLGRRRGMRPG
jgi:hypothetical protein